MASPEFARLDAFTSQDRDDIVRLLGVLSRSFTRKSLDEQVAAVDTNVHAILNNPNAAMLVHRDPDSKRLVSTLTVNAVTIDNKGTLRGWIDDVSTLTEYQGRGLARAGMNAGHEELRNRGVQFAYLTSSPERDAAGTLYDKLGYRKGGRAWRAAITDALDMDFVPSESGLLVPALFKAVDCTIPTGHKAWEEGPQWSGALAPALGSGLREAQAILHKGGATSANYFLGPDESLDPQMEQALAETGHTERNTRVYTLNLEQPAA